MNMIRDYMDNLRDYRLVKKGELLLECDLFLQKRTEGPSGYWENYPVHAEFLGQPHHGMSIVIRPCILAENNQAALAFETHWNEQPPEIRNDTVAKQASKRGWLASWRLLKG